MESYNAINQKREWLVTFKHENSSVRIHTLFYGAISLMQMYLSDSMVTCVKVMNCGLIPTLANCKNEERIGESENDERMGNAARHCGENDERVAKCGPLRLRAWWWGRSRPWWAGMNRRGIGVLVLRCEIWSSSREGQEREKKSA